MADKGFILLMAGQTYEGVRLLKQVESADPSFSEAHRYLAFADFNQGDFRFYFEEEAIASRLMHDSDRQLVLEDQRKGFAVGGVRGLEEATLRAHQKLYDEGRASDFALALDYSLLNDKAEALRNLELAYEKRDPLMASILGQTDFTNIRQEPGFKDLVAKVGLPPLR